jgi:L-ascorbate metabolism protein UlaG (beta-lactamase superfamily)
MECAPIHWVLLTHAHDDHTDLATLLPLLDANPCAQVMAPSPCRQLLLEAGVPGTRLKQPAVGWADLGADIQVRSIPAAHPRLEFDPQGNSNYVGYLLRYPGGTIYHAGDTSPHPVIFSELSSESGIDWALVPVNERNYFREADGIIGNMSVREAFQFAECIGARRVIPIHWDLFRFNSTSPEEIQLLHQLEPKRFELHVMRIGETKRLLNLVA